MEPTDLTIQILQEIRGEIRQLRDDMNERIGETNSRLDSTNEHLESLGRRQTETEVRLATEIIAVAQAVKDVKDLLHENIDVRPRVEDHERRLSLIEERLGNSAES